MKQKLYIYKALGVFMSLFVLATVLSKNLVQDQIQERFAAQSDQSDDTNPQETYFSELSSDVVIPSVAFDFAGVFILMPVPEISLLAIGTSFLAIPRHLYGLSYFEKLFEHHIAINAP
jgi:hypothetical protein